MSCGLHDVIAIERLGIPATIVGTEVFRAEAEEQARALGMPQKLLIEVPHPIQPIPMTRVESYADAVIDRVVAAFTGG